MNGAPATMGSAKKEETSDDVASHDTRSGVRLESERETTPAPAFASAGPEDLESPEPPAASRRPTEVPRYDVTAHAQDVSFRHPPPPRLPNDVAIPVRTAEAPRTDLELRAAFVLLHVDDRASIAEIAALTALPVEEVSVLFVGLLADGLVTLKVDGES